jgi:mRNA interferase MazF
VALIRRGDVYLINFRPDGRTGEAAQVHPGVVITNNLANANAEVLTVVPLTSNLERIYITNVLLPLERTGLNHHSKAQIEALRAVHVSRLIKPIGYVPEDLMQMIDTVLRMHLAL